MQNSGNPTQAEPANYYNNNNTNNFPRTFQSNQYTNRNNQSQPSGYNNYNNNKRQTNYSNHTRAPFYPNSNHSMARNALGVSTSDVLPLNKPIIPLEKITKYEHHQSKSQKTKQPLNLFNTNIYNLAAHNNEAQGANKKQNNNSILDDGVKKKLLAVIDKFLNENNKNEENSLETTQFVMNNCIGDLKELKISNEKFSEAIHLIIIHSLSKSDADRLNISRLFIELNTLEVDSSSLLSTEHFMNSMKHILQNLINLESEYHCVKSNISLYAARAVCDQIITFDDLSSFMKHGAHYPLFFLCMQNMHKLETKEWLRAQLEKSKISLIEMLPSSDRYKERLIQILEDRELSFVYPMLKIESLLLEKIQSNTLTNDELKEWIDANVSANVTNSTDFIHSLVTCIVKNAAENSVLSAENNDFNSKMDKSHVNKQKQLIQKYQKILQDYLTMSKSKLSKQIEAINAMQVYANSKGFPKYFLAHLFNQMYDLEIIEEEAFLQWKDEINENYPNKGQALFYLQRWFNWLQEASEESSSSEKEDTNIDQTKVMEKKIDPIQVWNKWDKQSEYFFPSAPFFLYIYLYISNK